MEFTTEHLRSGRRSIFCKNSLWYKIEELSKERNTSLSKYIIEAITEKIERENKNPQPQLKPLDPKNPWKYSHPKK